MGWYPESGAANVNYFIEDVAVTENSVVMVTLDSALNFGSSCKVMQLISGDGFMLRYSDRGEPNSTVPVDTNLN
jgi:hypothetical protein